MRATPATAAPKKSRAVRPARARARTPDRTREALLEAAQRLFGLKGYDGVSVKELAAEAGVNVSLVSYHFDGKLGLYRTCLAQFGRQRLAAAERILAVPATRAEFPVRLELFLEELAACHVSEPQLAMLVQRECEQAFPRIPDIFQDTFLRIFTRLHEFIREGQRRGVFRRKVDGHLASAFLFGGLLHLIKSDEIGKRYFGRSVQDAKYRRKITRTFIDIFLGGFAV